MSALDRVLERVERVTRTGDDILASCPVPSHGLGHGDRHPSLSIASREGKVLLNCMGGCHAQDVVLALGLDWPDLFDEDLPEKWEKVAEWPYQRPDGTVHFTVERWRTPDGRKVYTQRVPGHDKAGYPSGFQPCLYGLPEVLAERQRGGTIWIVEGEKCVSAARRLGLVATTAPNGSGKWRDYYGAWLTGAHVNIVVDNDESGRHHGMVVTASLRGKGIPVRTWEVALDDPKADLYDHVLAGYGVEDLKPVNLNRLRPAGVEADILLTKEFPPIKWAVEGLLSTGLALLGGPPKASKSMISLDMALGVACGGRAMSELTCCQGDVLYLSLDNDSERRLADRMRYLLLYQKVGIPIEFHVDWPTGEEAVAACREWVIDTKEAGRDPRFIVIDTLIKVEPKFEGDGRENGYASSTSVLSRWAKFADEADVAILAVHHDRKSRDDADWLNRFTGSRGITATAQTLMMLDVKRGEKTGWLRVTGRDIETDDLELQRFGWTWVTMDRPRMSGLPRREETSEQGQRDPHGAA